MSQTFDIKCNDCKETLWIGQRDHIYTTPEALDTLNKFLFSHIGHSLTFDADSDNEYSDFEDKGQ